MFWGRVAITRGGSWINSHRNARCAYRNRNIPDNFNNNIGFRVVVSIALGPGRQTPTFKDAGRRQYEMRASLTRPRSRPRSTTAAGQIVRAPRLVSAKDDAEARGPGLLRPGRARLAGWSSDEKPVQHHPSAMRGLFQAGAVA